MHKIKILHIIKSLGRGGAEVLLPETLKIHDKNRFQFYYIYFLPWKNQMVDAIEAAGGEVKCYPASNNLNLILKFQEVIKFCQEKEIDLIHCHLPWSGFLGRIVYQKTKIPVIYTEHNIQEKYHFITKTLNKVTFNWQTLSLGVSGDVSESIIKNIKPQIPSVTLLNGVNTEVFVRDEEKGNEIRNVYDIPLDGIVIGNIAVFRTQKNLIAWLKAFKEVAKVKSNIFGLLVGAGPMEEEIKGKIHDLGLTGKVILPGLQTETIPYFSAMDIFMMSSNFEGLPIALLEAMSMNCPIVSTKAGGVAEVVRHNREGLLSEVGDWHALSQNALELINNPEKRKSCSDFARERVVENFSLSGMVNSLENIYLEHSNIYQMTHGNQA